MTEIKIDPQQGGGKARVIQVGAPSSTKESESAAQIRNLALIMELERMARKANTKEELGFVVVNQTRRIINYTQAALLLFDEDSSPFAKVLSISGIAVIDKHVPMAIWLKKVVRAMASGEPNIRKTTVIDEKYLNRGGYEDWKKFASPHLLWVPFLFKDGSMVGGMVLMHKSKFAEHETLIVDRLAETYGYAMGTTLFAKRKRMTWNKKKKVVWSGLAIMALAMLLPVRMSALAKVAIEPYEARMVSAPIDGIISQIEVSPNSYVEKDDLLFTFDDTSARNSYEVAAQALKLARAKRDRARQGAFRDDASKRELAVLESEVRLRETELLYAREVMEKINVKSERGGLLLFDDPKALIGRPVKVGERIMMIADPNSIRAVAQLVVTDAIVLQENAPVTLFLDVDPLNPIKANVEQASYQATSTPEGKSIYRVSASIDEKYGKPRIGLQGTAKIYGERTTLFFYLFRKPISIVRKTLGL